MIANSNLKPNILFIVADDLNAWIGALGRHPDVKTPNIDALARRGTLFTHAYCNAPYCNASRMSVFTGCLPTTTGVYANEPFWDAPNRRPTFVEGLRQAGYYTAGAGKVFHGVFDYATAGRDGAPEAQWREIENRPFLWDEFTTNGPDQLPDGRPLNGLVDFSDFAAVPQAYHHFDWGPLREDRSDRLPDAAVVSALGKFLRAPAREPFLCAAGLYKPHLPWYVPARFFDLYDLDTMSVPLVKEDDLDDVPEIARRWALSPPDHELVTGRGLWREAVRGYLASISYCDFLVGELLAALEAGGLSERTIIVLWGDNGFHLGEKLHWRKFVLWEEATRVPFIVVQPGERNANRRVHDPVALVDLFPTLFGLCGLAPLPDVDGRDLSPVLAGSEAFDFAPAIMTWGEGNHSVRTRDWRFTRYRDGSEELYDHNVDPYEWTNLALESAYDGVRNRLRTSLPATS